MAKVRRLDWGTSALAINKTYHLKDILKSDQIELVSNTSMYCDIGL